MRFNCTCPCYDSYQTLTKMMKKKEKSYYFLCFVLVFLKKLSCIFWNNVFTRIKLHDIKLSLGPSCKLSTITLVTEVHDLQEYGKTYKAWHFNPLMIDQCWNSVYFQYIGIRASLRFLMTLVKIERKKLMLFTPSSYWDWMGML